MSFRLVPKIGDLERRNERYFALFQGIRVASADELRKSSRSLGPISSPDEFLWNIRCGHRGIGMPSSFHYVYVYYVYV